jgi:translation elongation factor EF-1beta
MAKIASPAKIRRRLHAFPVAFGLLALLTVVMLTRQGVGM